MAVISDFTIINGDEIGLDKNKNSINEVKTLLIETANTVDAGDTIALTMADYGMTTILGIFGVKHTTDNSIIVAENPTTAVAAGVLTLTVPAGTDDDKRVCQIYFI